MPLFRSASINSFSSITKQSSFATYRTAPAASPILPGSMPMPGEYSTPRWSSPFGQWNASRPDQTERSKSFSRKFLPRWSSLTRFESTQPPWSASASGHPWLWFSSFCPMAWVQFVLSLVAWVQFVLSLLGSVCFVKRMRCAQAIQSCKAHARVAVSTVNNSPKNVLRRGAAAMHARVETLACKKQGKNRKTEVQAQRAQLMRVFLSRNNSAKPCHNSRTEEIRRRTMQLTPASHAAPAHRPAVLKLQSSIRFGHVIAACKPPPVMGRRADKNQNARALAARANVDLLA